MKEDLGLPLHISIVVKQSGQSMIFKPSITWLIGAFKMQGLCDCAIDVSMSLPLNDVEIGEKNGVDPKY